MRTRFMYATLLYWWEREKSACILKEEQSRELRRKDEKCCDKRVENRETIQVYPSIHQSIPYKNEWSKALTHSLTHSYNT